MQYRILTKLLGAFVLVACAGDTVTNDQRIDQRKGVDPKVDYASLVKYGPWDDRNYELTSEDLKRLAANEDQLVGPFPAFFRVRMRKEMPKMQKDGPAQYPRTAAQIFFQQYGGYLINGKLYKRAEMRNGRYVVIQENGVDYKKPVDGKKKES